MHLNKLKLELNPNNQIVLTYGNYRNVEQFYKSRECGSHYDSVGKAKLARVLDNLEAQRETKYDWRGVPIVKAKMKPVLPLAIIRKSQDLQKSQKPNRPKSFTQAAGQKLRECGAAIDHLVSKPQDCYTITLTLAGDTPEAFAALAANTAFAVNYLFQPLRDQYANQCYWFFVWEYQARGALHMHIALYHPNLETTEYLANWIYARWHLVLQKIEKRTGVDMYVRKDRKTYTAPDKYHRYIAPVKRSLGAYFSKYAGKTESKNNWYCKKYPLSRFWGSSLNLKKLIKSLSLDFVLKSHESEIIEAMVADILLRLCRADISIKSDYDFDIRKGTNVDDLLGIAQGTRITMYCNPKSYKELLCLFSDLTYSF